MITLTEQIQGKQLIKLLAWLRLLITTIIISGAPISHASIFGELGQGPQFLPADQAFTIVGKQLTTNEQQQPVLTISWQIEPGYYLYQHRFSVQDLSTDNGQQAPVKFSQPGVEKFDEAFGDITAFYQSVDVDFRLPDNYQATITYQGCADAGLCYPPQTVNFDLAEDVAQLSTANNTDPAKQNIRVPQSSNIEFESPNNWFANYSPLVIIGLFFLMGLGLTFTPCVLPMIPILSSLIIGQSVSSSGRAFVLSLSYVLGMAITYALAGTVMGLLGASANLQGAMQSPPVLIGFALIFGLLALSMFGVYELALPRSLQNRLVQAQQQQKAGSLLGIGLMGALSALVVSPCISAPLAGALVYLSTTGDAILGGTALLALGLGMGVPLIVIATTGLRILPKSGPWMEQVKIFFGVLLILVAIWLLERLIPAAWVLISVGVVTFLYGVSLGALVTDQGQLTGIQRLQKGTAWLLLMYGSCTLIGGLQGNSLLFQPLSSNSQATQLHAESPFLRTDDVAQLQASISRSSMPVMVDLYADWCISCKVMEREVFSNAEIQQAGRSLSWLQLDMTDNTADQIAYLEQNGLFGPPAILFFENGSELKSARLVGEVSKEQFAEHLSLHFP